MLRPNGPSASAPGRSSTMAANGCEQPSSQELSRRCSDRPRAQQPRAALRAGERGLCAADGQAGRRDRRPAPRRGHGAAGAREDPPAHRESARRRASRIRDRAADRGHRPQVDPRCLYAGAGRERTSRRLGRLDHRHHRAQACRGNDQREGAPVALRDRPRAGVHRAVRRASPVPFRERPL